MRIAAKRFRYALELFEPCLGPDISIFAKKVGALQTSLGELHDSDIWIETLGKNRNGIAEQPKELRGAALWLLSHFVRLHSKHLRRSLATWSEWEAKEFGSRLREYLTQNLPVVVLPDDTSAPDKQTSLTEVVPGAAQDH
jgi:CHAD domain-containing protein